DGAVLTERGLEEALANERRLAVELNRKAIPYATLTREMESDRALYESVLTRLKETDVTRELAQDAVRVISRPLLPDRPVKPRKTIVLALTLLAGVFSGCAIAFLLQATDNTFQTFDDGD